MAAKYKIVTRTQDGECDKYLVYVGFERRNGFRWCTAPILCSSLVRALAEFSDRNGIAYSTVDEKVDVTKNDYCPNRGVMNKSVRVVWPKN